MTNDSKSAKDTGKKLIDRRGSRVNSKEELTSRNRDKDKGRSPIFMEVASPLEVPEINNDSEDEDYSVSVSAIMLRRASTRGNRKKGYKSPRRTSSPMGHIIGLGNERRRSSVYTTSSGDTAISFDDGTNQDSTQEQIFENIRLHKEVLQSVKLQPWSMRRKLRLVRQAKAYVARHEGVLQERFATKDLLPRFRIVLAAKWQHWRRELANIHTVLIPWERRIKEIESHFGSVVASYFTFLRWLFWVNIVIATVLLIFVVTPELLAVDPTIYDSRKTMLPEEKAIASRLITIWDFEGFLKYSPLFYGYYSDTAVEKRFHYKLPLAYFLSGLAVYIYSFVATLRKMAENSRMSKLSSKDDECVFSWKLFTGWDFMIGHGETAHNRIASVVLGFKEALLEEAEKKKDKRNWKVISLRIIANLLVLCLLLISAFAVVHVVQRSQELPQTTWWRRNEITVVMSLLSYFFPMIFEAIGFLESLHPRQQLRLQLARIMLLNLLNLYALIIALFDKIGSMTDKLKILKSENDNSSFTSTVSSLMETTMEQNLTNMLFPSDNPIVDTASKIFEDIATTVYNNLISDSTDTTAYTELTTDNCYKIQVDCDKSKQYQNIFSTSLGLLTLSTQKIFSAIKRKNKTNYDVTTNDFTTDYSSPSTDYYSTEADNFSTIDFSQYSDSTPKYLENSSWTNPFRLKRDITLKPDVENVSPEGDDGVFDIISNLYANIVDTVSTTDSTTEEIYSDYTSSSSISTILSVDESTTINPEESTTNIAEYVTTIIDELVQTLTEQISSSTTEGEICYEYYCPTTTPYSIDITSPLNKYDVTENEGNESDSMITDLSIIPSSQYPGYNINYTRFDESTTSQSEYSLELEKRRIEAHKREQQLRTLCWETMFGQELVKLTVMDLVITAASILILDFIRALFVRFMNKCWCWDLEKKFPKYGDFKIAENILHLVNNQGMIWMGMFFSPGLAVLNLFKLVIIMYLRSWAVLTCNVPHEVVFRASRSNNFYLALLLTMLFLCVLPVGYAIVWLQPSWHCGPFSNNEQIYKLFTNTIRNALPREFHQHLDYIASPSTVIPLLVLLILIIYYLVSLTNALKEANLDLKIQLRKERTEERRKMFKVAEQNPIEDTQNAPSAIAARWKKVLTSPVTPTIPGLEDGKAQARKELLARIMKKALRKGSATSDDDSGPVQADDGTDTEQHDSLPHDQDLKQNDKSLKKRRTNTKLPFEPNDKVGDASTKIKPTDIGWLQIMKTAGNKAEKQNSENEEKSSMKKRQLIQTTNDELLKNQSKTSRWGLDKNIDKVPSPPKYEEVEGEERKSKSVERSDILQKRQNKTNGVKTKPEYEVINEKGQKINQEKQKQTMEPEVFRFDDVMLQLKKEREEKQKIANEDDDYVSDDNSSYREVIFVRPRDVNSNSSQVEAPREIRKLENVQEAKEEKSSDEELRNKKVELKKDDQVKKKVETASLSPKEGTKGVKRLNSFLALVREAVQNKKQEGETKTPENIEEGEKFNFIKPLEDKSEQKNLESKKSFRKTTPIERTTKRQDSVASIWSDNIPVITISKTGSDECILEVEKQNPKQKKKKRSDGKKKGDD